MATTVGHPVDHLHEEEERERVEVEKVGCAIEGEEEAAASHAGGQEMSEAAAVGCVSGEEHTDAIAEEESEVNLAQ